MSAKLTLSTLASLQNQTSALTIINNNFEAVADKIDTLVSRDGDTPNQMESNLDMNSNRITNLPAPTNVNEPARLQDIIDIVSEGVADSTIEGSKLAPGAAATNLGATAFGLDLINDADAAAGRTTLGLGNVNNTADTAKPVSTAQQTALDLKANLASPTFTGTPTAPTATAGTNTTQLATTAFVTTAVGTSGIVSPWEISGLEPTRYSSAVILVAPGGAANSYNDPTEMLRLTSNTLVDLTVNGLNGLDTGTITNYDEIYLYLIKHLTTGVVGIVASKSISYGGVTYPSGYSSAKARKLPWGIVYRSGGLPSFHYTHRKTMFTEPDVEGGFFWPDGAYNVDTAGSWTTIDLKPSSGTKIIPDNSRYVYLWVRTDYVSASGRSYIRTPSTSGSGKTTGYVTSSLVRSFVGDVGMQTNSLGQIQIKTDSGVKIWVSVTGYDQSEYS